MNAITKALREIHFRIPNEVLREVFQPKTYTFRADPISVDEQIMNTVILARVMDDCDMVGGTETLLPLGPVPYERVENYAMVFRIPKDMTQGRRIVNVLSLNYLAPGSAITDNFTSTYTQCGVTAPLIAGQAMMNAMTPPTIASTARVQLIGENVVMVYESFISPGSGFLRVKLGYDENLSGIQVQSIPKFSKLVELAVKSYIYNNYSIFLDKGRIQGGFEIGRFKEFVDSYADAEQMYQDYLQGPWAQTAFANDRETYERFIKLSIGGFR